MTFREYAIYWLQVQKLFIRQSTYEALTVYINVHLIPHFNDKKISELTPGDCQNYAVEKLTNGRADGRGGLSAVSVRKHISILKQLLDDCVRQGYIDRNPAIYVRLPRIIGSEAKTVTFLTVAEARKVLGVFRDTELYPAVLIGLYYGLRKSEVLGLKWCAIDLENDTLTVKHTVVKNVSIIAEDATKSVSSRRTFQLLPEAKNCLLELMKRPHVSDYIFHRSDGSPLRPDSFTRSFQRVLKRAGFPKMRFHDLRHSTASMLFELGWSLEDVKNWLGHSDIETTSNIYLHYTASRKQLVASGLAGLLVENEKKP